MRSPRTLVSAPGILALALATDAWAQAPAGVPGAENFAPSLRAEDEGAPKPYAEDERSGHVLVRGSAGLLAPAGSVAEGVGFSDAASLGGAFGGGIGVGVSRYVELDLSASFALLGAPDRCGDCAASSFAASLGVSYHLAQGVALDPWIRFGAGFRSADVDTEASDRVGSAPSGSYLGLDVAQLGLGASFAPVGGVAFGPYVELDLGTFLERPERTTEAGSTVSLGGSTYAFFSVGLRFELDPVRWFDGAAGAGSASTAVSDAGTSPTGDDPRSQLFALPSRPHPL